MGLWHSTWAIRAPRSFACTHELGHASDTELVEVEHPADHSPIPSAVRLIKFDPPPEDAPDQMEMAECQVGEAALRGTGGWLVLGAKRILADADPNALHDFWLGGHQYTVRKTLPAELFLSEIFRAFHREKFGFFRFKVRGLGFLSVLS